ncbi:hypothetical protein [Paracoccus beibuensis]|nr:hypothetical protein [Paracoccus beibuensis]
MAVANFPAVAALLVGERREIVLVADEAVPTASSSTTFCRQSTASAAPR